jgi:uncharacterized protein (TIGR02328 family)
MRLWHEKLLPYLPALQFNGQHRECCALRGKGWGKKHSTIQYVFDHSRLYLAEYHRRYLILRSSRRYEYDDKWICPCYRGKNCVPDTYTTDYFIENLKKVEIVYPEHDLWYLRECMELLIDKINLKPFNYSFDDIYRLMEFHPVFKARLVHIIEYWRYKDADKIKSWIGVLSERFNSFPSA